MIWLWLTKVTKRKVIGLNMHIGKSQKYKLLTDTAKEDFNINKWYELNSQLVFKFQRVSTSLELRCNFFVPFFEDTHSDKSLPADREFCCNTLRKYYQIIGQT